MHVGSIYGGREWELEVDQRSKRKRTNAEWQNETNELRQDGLIVREGGEG